MFYRSNRKANWCRALQVTLSRLFNFVFEGWTLDVQGLARISSYSWLHIFAPTMEQLFFLFMSLLGNSRLVLFYTHYRKKEQAPIHHKELQGCRRLCVPIFYGPISCTELRGEDRSYGGHALVHRPRTRMVLPPGSVSWLGGPSIWLHLSWALQGVRVFSQSEVLYWSRCDSSTGRGCYFTELREAVTHWDSERPGSLLSASLCSSRGHLCVGNLPVQVRSSTGPGASQKGGRGFLSPSLL